MKRHFILSVLFTLLTLGTFAQSDPITNPEMLSQPTDTVIVQTVVQSKPAESFRDHWTLGLKGGLTYFALWKEQTSPKAANGGKYGIASDLSHQFSIFTEYAFDYGLGVGAYFGNYSYNRQAVVGSSIEFGIYSHMSLLESFSWGNPLPISRRFHIFWDAGLGVAALWQLNQILGDASSDKVFWNPAAVVRTALQFEFLIRPNWGIMLEGEYHGYGRGNEEDDKRIYASPWINAGMISGGIRYYFDTRKKEHDPALDETDWPVQKIRKTPTKTQPAPKNAVYVNVNITPEMIEAARKNGGSVAIQSTGLDGMPQSSEIESALKVLEEQGIGTVLINSIQFVNEQLTDESMLTLDKVAGSLLANNLWTKVDLLYMSDSQSAVRASVIATYLRAKGVRNISVKGYDSKSRDATSDLVITIK